MNFRLLFITVTLLMSLSAHAFELIMIQAVSDTKKTFITRNGKRQGIIRGMTGTFTAEDVSVLAKAINVTGNFAQWELINKQAILPFEKGATVTYYAATEYLWALSPESERKKYIKSAIPTLKQSWIFKGALTRGVAESVSQVQAGNTTRGGFLGEIYYEKEFYGPLAVDIGFRYEQEVINYTATSLVTKRTLIVADVIYYFDFMREYLNAKYFFALGAGYGLSNTETIGLIQSGPVSLLPVVKLGMSLPFNETWEFMTDVAFETLQTNEEQEGGNEQSTSQTNFKFGFGLRRYF